MPISDLVYNSDIARMPDGCGCGSSSSSSASNSGTNSCDCNKGAIAYFVPPPAIDVTRYPYPPIPFYPPCPPHHHHHDDEEESSAKQSAAEKQICKLSKKASAIKQIIENLETKNKPCIVKSGAASYNLGSYKTTDPEDPDTTIENEHIETILEILKAELETIKEEIKEASDKLTDD